MTRTRLTFSLIAVWVCLSPAWVASDDAEPVSGGEPLANRVQQLLADRCLKCHGDREPEGGLRLTSLQNLTARNDSGAPAIVVGKSDESELIRRVTAAGDERMPPEGEPLSADEIAFLRLWIDAGAEWHPTGESGRHWAYVLPVRPSVPIVAAGADVRNAIDAFVQARLANVMPPASPASPAEPATLLRRVSLDLIGLPPSVAEVDAFLDDPSAAHYEQIVDRLLNSPRYGEKWARSWLDLARYADSNGYQADQFREIWAYRDWVVQAFNDDMPFDQFTIEQIAGDLLPEATIDQKIATGFHRCTTCNVEAGVDPEENRVNQIVDRVNTTGTVWLGTTLECAQCHNHKYDPFTQQDYYQLFAFFNNTPLEVKRASEEGVAFDTDGPDMELPLSVAEQQQLARLKQQQATAQEQLDERRNELRDSLDEWCPENRETLKVEVRDILAKDVADRTENDSKKLLAYRESVDEEFSQRKRAVENVQKQLELAGPSTTLIMVEQAEPRMTAIFKRGNFLQRGAEVTPATPAPLHALAGQADGEGRHDRLALAHWLVSEENPLVARVTVNRWWAEMFGRGLVETVEDFGTQGSPPTHPELLDWLAVEFMESGWSMKHMHKRIVMSATYQQDSRVTSAMREQDPDNQWLARGPRFRLPAELIRDNALAVSGLLADRMGGPPVYPPQPEGIWRHTGRNPPKYETDTDEDRFRRGLYVIWRRSAAYPSFVSFDAPDRAACCVRRSTTNTPLQALTLLNDPAYYEMAVALAERIEHDLPEADDRDRVEYGFRRTLARQPTSDEVDILLEQFRSELDIAAKSVAGPEPALSEDSREFAPSPRLAAWTAVANVLFNLDESITKE